VELTKLAAVHKDKPAVIMGETGESLSYAELERRSNQIARLFRDQGLEPGDHIAILMENRLDYFPVVWAAQRTGLLYTPVNWHLSAEEAAYVVENCDARILVFSAQLHELAEAVVAPALERRYVVGGEIEGVQSLDDAVVGLEDGPLDGQVEGYYMFYSSGTTGRPKGILPKLPGQAFGGGLPIDHMMGSAFGFTDETVYLSPGPLYHAAPLAWSLGTVRHGGTAVVMGKFEAELALRLIDRYHVTHAQFVPTMFVRMLKLPADLREGQDVSSLQLVVHAAAPCPVEVKEQMIGWLGPKVVEFYSGSEGTGFFMIDTPTWLSHKGSVGRPVLGVVHILDEDGIELPPGEIGTVWFSEVNPFEYHGDPEKTAGAFNDKGWNTLGDLGHVDEEGFLYLSDRRTDLILSGGVNIYPREIEDALALHPRVADVAVIGIPHAEFGQSVHAVVQPATGAGGTDLEDELIAYLKGRIARYKVPRTVSFETVPRLPSGKILRRELMKRYEKEDAP